MLQNKGWQTRQNAAISSDQEIGQAAMLAKETERKWNSGREACLEILWNQIIEFILLIQTDDHRRSLVLGQMRRKNQRQADNLQEQRKSKKGCKQPGDLKA